MVTIVIRKNLVKKAAGVSVACALTIGMNVVIAGSRSPPALICVVVGLCWRQLCCESPRQRFVVLLKKVVLLEISVLMFFRELLAVLKVELFSLSPCGTP